MEYSIENWVEVNKSEGYKTQMDQITTGQLPEGAQVLMELLAQFPPGKPTK